MLTEKIPAGVNFHELRKRNGVGETRTSTPQEFSAELREHPWKNSWLKEDSSSRRQRMDKEEMRNFPRSGVFRDRVGIFSSCCSGGAAVGVGSREGAGDVLMLWLCPHPKSRIPGVLARSPRSCTRTWSLLEFSWSQSPPLACLGRAWSTLG